MGTKRHSKTASQQCRYYEVDNIFEYMVDTYINGNITSFKDIYRELNKYVCEKITATFKESGMSQLLKGTFYRVLDDE